MERRRFVSFNLTLFFFFFLLLPHLHRSKSRIHRFTPVLSNALVLSLSLEISCILKLKHDYISVYIYIYRYIYTQGDQFSYSSEWKTHNRLPHRPSSILINCLRPPHHTPPVKLKWVQFWSMQTSLVGYGQNLNRPTNFHTPRTKLHKACHIEQYGKRVNSKQATTKHQKVFRKRKTQNPGQKTSPPTTHQKSPLHKIVVQ